MKRYAISDPKYFGRSKESFEKALENLKNFDYILYRDKENLNYKKSARIFSDILKKKGVEKYLIHGDIFLAKELDAFGVHLTSTQFEEIELSKENSLFTVISCHSFKDIERAKKLGADAVTYSPIFETPNKGKSKGVEKLKEAVKLFHNIKIFALGGIISGKEVSKLGDIEGIYGFSSIRFFL
ncbi:thiamine monophosphate synthase [Thiovulum sp. ES]|nr:thiamine monophosphate synthase [Thiovulum sp. ES]